MSVVRALRCDAPDCDVISFPWQSLVRFFPTPRDGRHKDERLHYCYEHYPLASCEGCGRKLRPYQSAAEDWPGTISKAKSDPPLCSNCSRKGYDHVSTKADVTPEVAAKVRRLVYSRFDDSTAAEVLVMLGLD